MDLTGKLLLAMPGLGDLRFDHSVVFLCSHSDEGAMGLIVNREARDVVLGDVLSQLDMQVTPDVEKMPVNFGGPVETSRGFVLHSPEYESVLETLHICADFSMTATLDVLEDIGKGEGPARAILALGYAGWGPGQLEAEIAHNSWLTCDATPELVFDGEDTERWVRALASIGVDPLILSADAGRA